MQKSLLNRFTYLQNVLGVLILIFLLGIINWFPARFIVSCEEEIIYFGEKYPVVRMGNRCWMAENLRTKNFSDGSPIRRIDVAEEWAKSSKPAYAVYPEDAFALEKGALFWDYEETGENEGEQREIKERFVVEDLGFLYNLGVVSSSSNVCPEGWSVPSHYEWTDLERSVCLGWDCNVVFPLDSFTTGSRGGDESCRLLGSGVGYACNLLSKSRFNVLPGGYRNQAGDFVGGGVSAHFWTSMSEDGIIWTREIYGEFSGVERQTDESFLEGFSIRCIKDR